MIENAVMGEVFYVSSYCRMKYCQCSLEADPLKLGVNFLN